MDIVIGKRQLIWYLRLGINDGPGEQVIRGGTLSLNPDATSSITFNER